MLKYHCPPSEFRLTFANADLSAIVFWQVLEIVDKDDGPLSITAKKKNKKTCQSLKPTAKIQYKSIKNDIAADYQNCIF